MKISKWDQRFLELASVIASWSKDPSTKTGAVIVDENKHIVSVGYNGFPKGVLDSSEKLNNRVVKLNMIVHCEINALVAAAQSVKDCTLYTYPFISCSRCASVMIQAGIKRVVGKEIPKEVLARWGEPEGLTVSNLREAGIEVCLI